MVSNLLLFFKLNHSFLKTLFSYRLLSIHNKTKLSRNVLVNVLIFTEDSADSPASAEHFAFRGHGLAPTPGYADVGHKARLFIDLYKHKQKKKQALLIRWACFYINTKLYLENFAISAFSTGFGTRSETQAPYLATSFTILELRKEY